MLNNICITLLHPTLTAQWTDIITYYNNGPELWHRGQFKGYLGHVSRSRSQVKDQGHQVKKAFLFISMLDVSLPSEGHCMVAAKEAAQEYALCFQCKINIGYFITYTNVSTPTRDVSSQMHFHFSIKS